MRAPCLAALLLLLAACAGEPRAPVEEGGGRSYQRSATTPSQYSVQRGDTLYAIAWRFGFDFRALARANNISAPYTIYPGQVIALRAAPAPAPARSTASTPQVTSKPAPGTSTPTPPPPKPQATTPRKFDGRWSWPTSGKVVRGYSGTHKGVDIGGKEGDPVRAVAAGRVVYAGTGIVGYGRLLIVKHDEVYLSAYGHNRRLLVAEGELVNAGQRIAEKGSSATDSVKLHFEIRREGKPVDPLKLLPKR